MPNACIRSSSSKAFWSLGFRMLSFWWPYVVSKDFFFNPPRGSTKLFWQVSLSLGRFYFCPDCQCVVHHCMIIAFPEFTRNVLSATVYLSVNKNLCWTSCRSLRYKLFTVSSFINQTCHIVFCMNINEEHCPFYQGEIIGIQWKYIDDFKQSSFF